MTPKEKANELIEKFQSGYIINGFSFQFMNDEVDAKQCALIAVEELIEECRLEKDWYWEEVKQEIGKL